MPIEIKELVIKAVVDESESTRNTQSSISEISEDQVEQIVSLCVDKVLDIIKEKNER